MKWQGTKSGKERRAKENKKVIKKKNRGETRKTWGTNQENRQHTRPRNRHRRHRRHRTDVRAKTDAPTESEGSRLETKLMRW